jgi:hypothetical protein
VYTCNNKKRRRISYVYIIYAFAIILLQLKAIKDNKLEIRKDERVSFSSGLVLRIWPSIQKHKSR